MINGLLIYLCTSFPLFQMYHVKWLSLQVICICNDLYAPVLRPLRQVAKYVSFFFVCLQWRTVH